LNSFFSNSILSKFAPLKILISFIHTNFYKNSILDTKENILILAKNTILSESESIAKLIDYIDNDFVEATQILFKTKGRIIVTGIGKSAIIAQKMVATFNSTGSPSLFLHASEAIHGDLGMVQNDDVVICISKSGNSPEIKILVPILKRFGNKLIAITGNMTSFLAKESDFVLNTTVDSESCPLNLAPTNSTTAQLVMGDALAVCLMNLRNFTSEDFAKYHPGGALGKKLLFRVSSMLENSLKPMVASNAPIKKAVVEEGKVIGIITDGDIRRMLNERDTLTNLTARDIMTKNPKTIQSTTMVADALNILEDFSITQLIVVDNGDYKGVIHLHDILKEGIV
jgi:arabinose-5-phosphate isomerase